MFATNYRCFSVLGGSSRLHSLRASPLRLSSPFPGRRSAQRRFLPLNPLMSWRTPHGNHQLFKQLYPFGRLTGRVRPGLHGRVHVVINQLIMKCTPTTNFSGSKRFVVRAHKQLGVSLVLVTPHTMSWPTSDGTISTIGERLGAPTVAVVIMTLLRNRPMSLTSQDWIGSLERPLPTALTLIPYLSDLQSMDLHFRGHPRCEVWVRPVLPWHFP